MVRVVRAKTQCAGDLGGARYSRSTLSGMSSLGKDSRNEINSSNDLLALFGGRTLNQVRPSLWREDAHPYFFRGGVLRPEGEEVAKVSWAIDHRTRNGAVNGDMLALDVAQDLVVRGRFAALVMLWLQAVNGDRYPQVRDRSPRPRDGPERASHHLDMDAARGQLRQQHLQFTIANQRISPHNREMQRLVLVN